MTKDQLCNGLMEVAPALKLVLGSARCDDNDENVFGILAYAAQYCFAHQIEEHEAVKELRRQLLYFEENERFDFDGEKQQV